MRYLEAITFMLSIRVGALAKKPRSECSIKHWDTRLSSNDLKFPEICFHKILSVLRTQSLKLPRPSQCRVNQSICGEAQLGSDLQAQRHVALKGLTSRVICLPLEAFALASASRNPSLRRLDQLSCLAANVKSFDLPRQSSMKGDCIQANDAME